MTLQEHRWPTKTPNSETDLCRNRRLRAASTTSFEMRFINGLSSLVYQSLEGTRFPHALGAFHIARKIMRHLQNITPDRMEGFPQYFRINDRTAYAFSLAALLHDIAHGPLSHISEEL